jgi:hypothetical protein
MTNQVSDYEKIWKSFDVKMKLVLGRVPFSQQRIRGRLMQNQAKKIYLN